MRTLLSIARHAVVFMLLACGDDADHGAAGAGGDDPEAREVAAIAARLEGIYEITFHETNLDACELGGTPTEGHPFFVIFTRPLVSLVTVFVMSCTSVEECRQLEPASGTFYFVFDQAHGEASLVGGFLVEVKEGEQCHHRDTYAMLLETASGELRIEARTWRGEDYPVGSDGRCTISNGRFPSRDDPCTQLEVLEASMIEGPR
jgi:hypothetical protein